MIPKMVIRSVLAVSATQKGMDHLTKLLRDSSFSQVSCATNGGEARRLLLSSSFDAMVINAPLGDEFGHELALHGAEQGMPVLVLVKNELFGEVSSKLEQAGILTVGKPFSAAFFQQALSLLQVMLNRQRKYEEENKKLRTKMEELRIVSQAKCVLVEYLHLSEEQAHRYIEKQAMDHRSPKRAVAQEILETYG